MLRLAISLIAAAMPGFQADTAAISVRQIDDVEVVSGIKSDGRFRQQPASATVISGQRLNDTHITSLKGVSPLVPNLFIPDYGSRMSSTVYIRGVGSRMNTPAVGLYVDGIPYTDRSSFDFRFLDIEQVDVLRGPQGTLYGRNAMGGIIMLHTRDPFSRIGTDVSLGLATGDARRNMSVTRYGRISDRLAFSAGGYADISDGFMRNGLTGRKADASSSAGGRLRASLRTAGRLSADMTLSYDYSNEGGYPYRLISDSDPARQDIIGIISANRESSYRRGMLNAGLSAEYSAPGIRICAVTGFQRLSDRMFLDQDFIRDDMYTLEQRQGISTLSEEITARVTPGGMWEGITGLFLMRQWLHTTGPVTFLEDGIRTLEAGINSMMPDVASVPAMSRMGFSSMSVTLGRDELRMDGTFDTPDTDLAVFHQTTLWLSDRLSAVLGLRLDCERMGIRYMAPADIAYSFRLDNPRTAMMSILLNDLRAACTYDGRLSDTYLSLLPKAALRRTFGSGSSAYLSAARGMRSGGYNLQMFSDLLQGSMRRVMTEGIKDGVKDYLSRMVSMGMPESVIGSVSDIMERSMPSFSDPDVSQITYRPEYTWSLEAGAHLNLMKGSLQADAALFMMSTTDQQIVRFTESGLGRMMANAGSSESRGGELSVRWRADRHLTVMGNYGYTHSVFTRYDDGSGHDLTGNFVPFVPRHTFSADCSYSWTPSARGIGTMSAGADLSGAGKIYWTEANDITEPLYFLLGARVTAVMNMTTVTIWARNLTGERYSSFVFESSGRGFCQDGRPRQFGVDLKMSF